MQQETIDLNIMVITYFSILTDRIEDEDIVCLKVW